MFRFVTTHFFFHELCFELFFTLLRSFPFQVIYRIQVLANTIKSTYRVDCSHCALLPHSFRFRWPQKKIPFNSVIKHEFSVFLLSRAHIFLVCSLFGIDWIFAVSNYIVRLSFSPIHRLYFPFSPHPFYRISFLAPLCSKAVWGEDENRRREKKNEITVRKMAMLKELKFRFIHKLMWTNAIYARILRIIIAMMCFTRCCCCCCCCRRIMSTHNAK